MKIHPAFALIFALNTLSANAQTRPWKNTDGSRTIQADFIRRDATTVTIQNADGKQFTLELSKLHPDETAWLDSNHPVKTTSPAAAPIAETPKTPVFDELTFNDTRETAQKKLKASKLVEMIVDEAFIGRSGLNGAFRTRGKIGNHTALLFFDWTAANKLLEINLQTEPFTAEVYKAELEPTWKAFADLLTNLHDSPTQSAGFPTAESVPDSTFIPTHQWKIASGGFVRLGVGRDGKNYQIIARFSEKIVQEIPSP